MYNVCCVSCHGGCASPRSGGEAPRQSQPGLANLKQRGSGLCVRPELQATCRQPCVRAWAGVLQREAGAGQAAYWHVSSFQSRGSALPWDRPGEMPPALPQSFLCAGVWDQKARWCGGQGTSAPFLGPPLPWERRGVSRQTWGAPGGAGTPSLHLSPWARPKPRCRAACAPGPHSRPAQFFLWAPPVARALLARHQEGGPSCPAWVPAVPSAPAQKHNGRPRPWEAARNVNVHSMRGGRYPDRPWASAVLGALPVRRVRVCPPCL